MIRGTTPTHVYTLPLDTADIKKIRIIYKQVGRELVQKTEDDCELSGNTATVKLTQQETLMFNSGANVEIQVRVLTTGNDALASTVISVHAGRCLSEEVL